MNNTPDTLLSKCRECDNADPTSIASCDYCGRAVCDDCYALRHEGKKCIPAMQRCERSWSMSDRPTWMPSRESLLSLAHNETLYANCGHDYAGEELEEMVNAAGLCAQIAVLGSLIAHMRQRYTTPENPTGSYCNEESCWIADKIHALREELGE